jgi:hypothetical protein
MDFSGCRSQLIKPTELYVGLILNLYRSENTLSSSHQFCRVIGVDWKVFANIIFKRAVVVDSSHFIKKIDLNLDSLSFAATPFNTVYTVSIFVEKLSANLM